MSIRPVKKLTTAKPTLEGAGVHLRRAFGFGQTSEYDPFLLLDDFRNDVPADYLAGFPWHPHRGIETITPMRALAVKSPRFLRSICTPPLSPPKPPAKSRARAGGCHMFRSNKSARVRE
jgi:pirin-like protein